MLKGINADIEESYIDLDWWSQLDCDEYDTAELNIRCSAIYF